MKTNEQAKQEAIKKAYGEHWPQLSDYVNEDGWCLKHQDPLGMNLCFKDCRYKGENLATYWRPNPLDNLENNNGWTRIEPDGSNLPTDETARYKTGTLCFDGTFMPCEQVFHANAVRLSGSTHYKPIKEEPKPLY